MKKSINELEQDLLSLAKVENLEPGSTYTYKDHNYKINQIGQLRIPGHDDWVVCVSYTQDGTNVVFTRTLEDFKDKFTKV